MGALLSLYEVISAFTSWIWGIPLAVGLGLGGIVLTIAIGGVQFTKMGFIFRHTVGGLLDKEEREKAKKSGISPAQTVIAAVGASVGTGNIVGVGTAIALGGPGALFWMWVTAFVIMGMKYAENTLSCISREDDGHDGFRAGPYMYIKKGLNNPLLASVFGVIMLICLAIICAMHASSITANLASIGVPNYASCVVLTLCAVGIAVGGMKFVVKVTDKLVPFMGMAYILLGFIVIGANISRIGEVFLSIFAGAFSGTAAAGGFAGSTIIASVRWGVARACYSNDAGLGFSACVCAQSKDIGHPARQGMWAVIEVFIDTILICTTTALIILFSGVWTTGEGGATLAASGVASVLGPMGRVFCIVCLALFGLSSLIVDIEGEKIQAISMFKSIRFANFCVVVVLVMIALACLADVDQIFVFADFTNALLILINVPCVILLHKTLRKATDEWFGTDGHPERLKRD